MKKKFQAVILFEGTGLASSSQSNVARLKRVLCNDDFQVVCLLSGSGTYHFRHVRGAIAGLDATDILCDAYFRLSEIFEKRLENNPRIFTFGFSRGALYSRVLAACLDEVGIATNKKEAEKIFTDWLKNPNVENALKLKREGRVRNVDLRYIGAWDTVDATVGIEGERFIDVPPSVKAARHAVAINEYRSYFNYVPMRGERAIERFFPGSHTDIGGGYKEHSLADMAGEWVVRGGIREGLRVNKPVDWIKKDAKKITGTIHNSLCEASNLWGVMDAIKRKIDPERIHGSVRHLASRAILPDGSPVSPETFKDAPTS